MSSVIRDDACVWVFLKDVAVVRRIVPPRWAELRYYINTRGQVELIFNLERAGARTGGLLENARAPHLQLQSVPD